MRIRLAVLPLVFALGLCASASALSGEKATTPIHNVVAIDSLDCASSVPHVGWRPHPQRELIISSGLVDIGQTGYEIDLHALSDHSSWTLATRFHAEDRGVDDNYVLLTPDGMPTFRAAFVVTRLPEGSRGNTAATLSNVMDMQKSNADGHKLSFIRATTPIGDGLEMITGGRIGSHCFPTSHFKYADRPSEAAVGISRFVVDGDYLIEYTLSVPVAADISHTEMFSVAQQKMQRFQTALRKNPTLIEKPRGQSPAPRNP